LLLKKIVNLLASQTFISLTWIEHGKIMATIMAVQDYRALLDRDDIDVIAIASPDHWHAIHAINAMAAGKDVYVEKPLAATIHEGRQMVNAAKKFDRIAQVGLHRRSMKLYHRLKEYMADDKIGKITVSRAFRLNNMYPDGIGKLKTTDPPADFNWDMWLGPRPDQPYQENIAPYKFRWWQRFSSQMGNWGVHYFDAIRWMIEEESPSSVSAMGGRFAIEDDRTIPDTAQALFEMPGKSLISFGQYEASSNKALAHGEIEIRGTQGTVYASKEGFKVLPEKAGQFQEKGKRGEKFEFDLLEPNEVATASHARNFLDCVKSREETNCPMIDGHRSTAFAHMANISLATKSRLKWDAVNEKFDNPAANELLHYEYRKGFELPKF
jgi:predicted dehydrogenase